MQTFVTFLLAASLAALTGCSSYVKQSEVCQNGYYGYAQHGRCPDPAPKAMIPDASKDTEARIAILERENQRLANELNALQQRTAP